MTFKETQKFGNWILWLMRGCFILMLMLAIFVYLDGYTLIAIILFLSSLICLVLEPMHMKTEIDSKAIHINFVPLKKKRFEWSDIQNAEIIDYGFVGGWGIRLGTKYGTVYNTKGSEGLWLTLKDGKQFVIGTQRKDELQKHLDKYSKL
jgi:hypothetical protein